MFPLLRKIAVADVAPSRHIDEEIIHSIVEVLIEDHEAYQKPCCRDSGYAAASPRTSFKIYALKASMSVK